MSEISLSPAAKGRRPGTGKRAEVILDEALRLFAARHYTTVTMREIARNCGINQALIYYYFDSKEHLLYRALAYAVETLIAGYAARAPESLAPMAALSAWLEVNATAAPLVQLFVKVMTDYAASEGGDAAIDGAIGDFYRYEQDLIEAVLRRGVAEGVFRDLDIAGTARFIGLHLDGIFHASASRRDGRVVADIADLEGFLRSYLAPRPDVTE